MLDYLTLLSLFGWRNIDRKAYSSESCIALPSYLKFKVLAQRMMNEGDSFMSKEDDEFFDEVAPLIMKLAKSKVAPTPLN